MLNRDVGDLQAVKLNEIAQARSESLSASSTGKGIVSKSETPSQQPCKMYRNFTVMQIDCDCAAHLALVGRGRVLAKA